MTIKGHVPVMLREVMAALDPRDGEVFADGTFGGGGYAEAILCAASCTLFALDRDPDAIARGAALAARHPGRLHLVEGRFGDLVALLAARGVTALDGVVLDLGVSSFQLDEAERGFSFRADGPLDMRMERAGPSAADLVNTLAEGELATLIARRSVPRDPSGLDGATRTFQALRIEVNDELGEVERGLAAAAALLAPGGRLVVVAFHSLEDRIVKRFMAEAAGRSPGASRHDPAALRTVREAPRFALLHPRALKPQEDETRDNPRARSARLRALLRLPEAA